MSAAFASLMGTEARTSLWGQVPIHRSYYTHFSGLDGVGAEVTRPGASGSSWSPLTGRSTPLMQAEACVWVRAAGWAATLTTPARALSLSEPCVPAWSLRAGPGSALWEAPWDSLNRDAPSIRS